MNYATKWSASWKSSKKPKKQRKYVYNAPLHVRKKFLKSMVSKELKEKVRVNALTIRKGDKVKIMRGDRKGQEGEVIRVDYKNLRVYVDAVKRKNSKGEEKNIPIHASNLMITEVYSEDMKRFKRR